MKTTNKLKWESEVGDSARGWVTVIPTTGDGDTRVTINDDTTISMALKSGVTGQVTVDITDKYINNYGNKTTCQYSQIIVHII